MHAHKVAFLQQGFQVNIGRPRLLGALALHDIICQDAPLKALQAGRERSVPAGLLRPLRSMPASTAISHNAIRHKQPRPIGGDAP